MGEVRQPRHRPSGQWSVVTPDFDGDGPVTFAFFVFFYVLYYAQIASVV